MRTTTLQELAWLHDCVLMSVLYDATSDADRSIGLMIRCPSDLGYAPWNGRELTVVAVDVAMLRHIAWGVAGPETIDAVRPGISESARESTQGARQSGVRFPDIELTIAMQSGSSLELICRELEVKVL
jgi:hypothetical protein